MTANRGFIGMAAATIGGNQPFGALLMSFVFGVAYATTNYLQPYISDAYLLQSVPFILCTVVYLVISGYRSTAETRKIRRNRARLEKLQHHEA